MKKLKKVKIKSFSSLSGKLIPYTFIKNFPIKVKRIFFLYGKKNKIRGDHAHKKCSQLFVAISGKMLLEVKTPTTSKTFSIDEKKKYGVLVPPKYWCSIKFIKKKSILMVMNDRKYEFKDYLETFNSYKKYLQKK
tara:strand:+ start:57 stop:461 length:405 start_codon:yes stop_codon:yes gene_type:complete